MAQQKRLRTLERQYFFAQAVAYLAGGVFLLTSPDLGASREPLLYFGHLFVVASWILFADVVFMRKRSWLTANADTMFGMAAALIAVLGAMVGALLFLFQHNDPSSVLPFKRSSSGAPVAIMFWSIVFAGVAYGSILWRLKIRINRTLGRFPRLAPALALPQMPRVLFSLALIFAVAGLISWQTGDFSPTWFFGPSISWLAIGLGFSLT